MSPSSPDSLTVVARRRGRRLAYWNGGLWAVGNGLASTPLIIYLAIELGAPGLGLGIGLILATRNLVGALRMATPTLVERLGSRGRFCEASFVASAVLLAALPALATPGQLASPGASLAALVALWCAYHLAQYLAMVALWSWLGDLARPRIRGRFFGRRERWILAGEAAGMVAAGLYAWWSHAQWPRLPQWIGYVPPLVVGVGFLLAAVIPLTRMPRCEQANPSRDREGAERWRHSGTAPSRSRLGLATPLRDWRFRRLLLFACWFSFANGITQSAMNLYQAQVLLFPVLVILALKTLMRLGQVGLSPTAGRLADRLGNRSVMIVSLLVVAQGSLFYLLATPEHRWWMAGAWAAWIAWVGVNVALPNLILKLAPPESNLPYIATYYTIDGLCYAASVIAGGVLCDWLKDLVVVVPGGGVWSGFACLFFAGWILRMLSAVVLLGVVEPKSRG